MLGVKSSKGCTRAAPDIPTPLLCIIKLQLGASFCPCRAQTETEIQRDSTSPAETRITFTLTPTPSRFSPMLSFPTIAFPPQGASVLTQKSVLQMKNCIFLFPAASCDTIPNVTALKANYPTHLIWFCLIKTQIIHRDLFRLNPNSLDSLNQPFRKDILKCDEFWRSTLQALRGNQCMHRQQPKVNRESFAAWNL